jgi:hypothetical protein
MQSVFVEKQDREGSTKKKGSKDHTQVLMYGTLFVGNMARRDLPHCNKK